MNIWLSLIHISIAQNLSEEDAERLQKTIEQSDEVERYGTGIFLGAGRDKHFGFNITQEDSYGHALNEYEDAMEILKEVMNSEAYKRLKNTAVQ